MFKLRKKLGQPQSRALYIFYILLTFFFLIPFASWFLMHGDKEDIFGRDVNYKGEWTRIYEDGSRRDFTVPCRFKDVPEGSTLVFETTLPENTEDNTYICYRSVHQTVRMYLNGEKTLDYDTTSSPILGNNTASRYLFLEIGAKDAGATLRIETTSNSHFSGVVDQVFYGEMLDIWANIYKLKGAEILIGLMLWLLSVTVIGVSVVSDIMFKRRSKLIFLAWAEFWASSWMLFDSGFRQVIYSNSTVIACLAFLLVPLFCYATILYIDAMQGGRYHKQYMLVYAALALDIGAGVILHLAKIADVVQAMYVNYAISALSLMLVLVTILTDFKNRQIEKYKYAFIGYIMLFVGAAIDIIRSALTLNAFSGLAIGLGGMGFMIMGIWNNAIEQSEIEKEKQRQRLISETKDMFLATMSHEIRTPINSILGMNELILRENEDTHIKEYSENIERAGVMLLGLVNDILDFSKIGSGKLDILPAEYSLVTMISDLELLIRERADDKGLKVVVNVDETLPETLEGDVVRIKQVITNLLTNAVKYTAEGTVTMDVSGTYEYTDGFALKVSVTDTGQGIKEENLNKLFDYFTRLEEKSNKGIEGTGLGLTITKQLCHLMGGTIRVQSTFGKGSTFTVIIPQKVVSKKPIGDFNEYKEKEREKDKKHKVLFTAPEATVLAVDDNGVNLAVVKGLLKPTKVKIIAVKSGRDAIEKVKTENIDLILMDHMMPEMDGIEAFHAIDVWLKSKGREKIPTIALTANAIAGMREMYLSEGFEDYLSKPINPDELEKLLKQYLPGEKVNSVTEE